MHLRRLQSGILCVSLALTLAGCGGNVQKVESAASAAEETVESAASAAEEAAESAASAAESSAEEGNAAAEVDEEAWKAEPAYGKTLHYYTDGGCSAGPAMADYLGYFEEEGLKVEGLKSSASIVEAIGTGAVEIAIDHIACDLVPETNGADIAFVGGAHIGCKTLYVLGDSDYNTTADLKGQKISVPDGIGGADYNIAARFFDVDGIDPLNDVELTPVEAGACVASMQSGDIAGAILSDMFAYDLVADGTLKKVRSLLDDDFAQEPCCVIVMNKQFVKENPITAAKMASAVKRAHTWMRENMDECVDIMLDQGMASGDHEKVYNFLSSLQFGLEDDFTEAALRNIIHDYVNLKLITATDDEAGILESVWMPIGEG